jgi:GNAT superfamily N-acetyltransferase
MTTSVQLQVTKKEYDVDFVGAALFNEWPHVFQSMKITREDTCIDWFKLNYMYHAQNELIVGKLGEHIVCACTIDYTAENTSFLPCIGNVYTWPDYRGNGYATQMLDFIIHTRLTQVGFAHIYLWCAESMIPFYRKLGWQTFHRIDESRWIMSKNVDDGMFSGWNQEEDTYASVVF